MTFWKRKKPQPVALTAAPTPAPERDPLQRVEPQIERAIQETGVWWPPSYREASWGRRDE